MRTLIREIRDIEIFLALKKLCQYIENEAWHTSGDIDLDYAIAKTEQYEQDVRELAHLDGDLGWGCTKAEISPGRWSVQSGGDFNPWYHGELTLEELLGSFEMLDEETSSLISPSMTDIEFLHYYHFLYRQSPEFLEIVRATKPTSITLSSLHPKIQEHCGSRFDSKHYSDAILAAYKVVLNEIKDITGIHNLDGKPLVERSFSLNNPIIKLNPLVTQSDKDEQQGFMLLYSGAVIGIRNPKAHDLIVQEDKNKALLYLALVSLLMQRLDERSEPERHSGLSS